MTPVTEAKIIKTPSSYMMESLNPLSFLTWIFRENWCQKFPVREYKLSQTVNLMGQFYFNSKTWLVEKETVFHFLVSSQVQMELLSTLLSLNPRRSDKERGTQIWSIWKMFEIKSKWNLDQGGQRGKFRIWTWTLNRMIVFLTNKNCWTLPKYTEYNLIFYFHFPQTKEIRLN